jgi:hypothetical protein
MPEPAVAGALQVSAGPVVDLILELVEALSLFRGQFLSEILYLHESINLLLMLL